MDKNKQHSAFVFCTIHISKTSNNNSAKINSDLLLMWTDKGTKRVLIELINVILILIFSGKLHPTVA